MKKTVTFTITLDTETAYIEALEMIEGMYNRTEFIAESIDDPTSINNAAECIRNALGDMLDLD